MDNHKIDNDKYGIKFDKVHEKICYQFETLSWVKYFRKCCDFKICRKGWGNKPLQVARKFISLDHLRTLLVIKFVKDSCSYFAEIYLVRYKRTDICVGNKKIVKIIGGVILLCSKKYVTRKEQVMMECKVITMHLRNCHKRTYTYQNTNLPYNYHTF